MSNTDDLFWSAQDSVLFAYERALTAILEVLADRRQMPAFVRAVQAEPLSDHLTPAIDAYRVDPARLAEALDAFWTAYREVRSPPGANSYTKYKRFPEPYPSLQRGVLDQCYRVWYTRRHSLDEPVRSRLYRLICGDVSPPPGMEDYMKRYERLLQADFRREEPELAARIRKRFAT
jgi:hypothetical protein